MLTFQMFADLETVLYCVIYWEPCRSESKVQKQGKKPQRWRREMYIYLKFAVIMPYEMKATYMRVSNVHIDYWRLRYLLPQK
jgi:hypothetical protein